MAKITTHLLPGTIAAPQLEQTPQNLLILGTAVDGPIDRPVRINSLNEAIQLFGPADYKNGYKDPTTSAVNPRQSNGATIPLALHTALQEGATNIWVLRYGGSYAVAPSAFTNRLDIRSVYPGRIYNEVSVVTSQGTGAASGTFYVTINQPSTKGGNFLITTPTTTTISKLIELINNHPNNKTLVIDAHKWPLALASAVTALGSAATATLTGGTNGTSAPGEDYAANKHGLYSRLIAENTGPLHILRDSRRTFDIVFLSGIYADDEVVDGDATRSVLVDMAIWAKDMSMENGDCIVYTDTRPAASRDIQEIYNYYNSNLLATSTGYYNSGLRWIKLGPFLKDGVISTVRNVQENLLRRVMIVAGPDVIYDHPDIGAYTANPGISVAALRSLITPTESTTFKPVESVTRWLYTVPNKIATQLAAGVAWDGNDPLGAKGGYICLVPNSDTLAPGLIVFEDRTAAFYSDIFKNEQLTLLASQILTSVRILGRKYIGKPANSASLAALSTQITQVLANWEASGAFAGENGAGYRFTISQTPTQEVIGQLSITLQMRLARAITDIIITGDVTEA